METLKSLADQLREELVKPKPEKEQRTPSKSTPAKPHLPAEKKTPAILDEIYAFDTSQNKSMVHARFDSKTLDIMNKFKMAANVDVSKFTAFAVKHLIDTHPEIKTIIKSYLQNTEL